MNNYENEYQYTRSFLDFINSTFLLLAAGLAVTTGISFLLQGNVWRILYALGGIGAYLPLALCLVELAVCVVLSANLRSLSKTMAYTCFFFYSVLNGLSMSFLLSAYTFASATLAFGMTTVLFVCMSLIGHTTRVDLMKFSTLFAAGLLTILLGSVVNWFIGSSTLDWLFMCLGIVIFLGLIAYDMQKLRNLYNASYSDPLMSEKMIIIGAFSLYLDFINLFIRVMRLFGRRRD